MQTFKTFSIAVISAFVVSCAPAPAMASDDVQEAKEQACQSLQSLAAETMKARQMGIPMSNLLELINKQPVESESDKKNKATWKIILMESYEYPKFTGESYKKSIVNEFANKQMLRCLKSSPFFGDWELDWELELFEQKMSYLEILNYHSQKLYRSGFYRNKL